MESTLSLRYADIAAEVGLFLGYGRGAEFDDPLWTSSQQAAIDSITRSGLRQFYFPPPTPDQGNATSYAWSFLRPTTTLGIDAAAETIPLPDDFGGFDGQITLLNSSGQTCYIIPLVGEGMVRRRYTDQPNATGQPEMVAVEPIKGTGPTQGQRFQLFFWPAANQAYTVQFPYTVLADCLSGSRPYAYGGMAHAETILESCLSIAEQRLDDTSGVHTAKFMERLMASIAHDRKFRPEALGYNADRSDARHYGRYLRQRDDYVVTFNGRMP